MKNAFIALLWLCVGMIFPAQAQISETKYDYSEVSRQITDGCTTQYEQARAIYRWLCENISYDLTYTYYTADDCWDHKSGVCQGYCELFYRLGEPVGVKCHMIVGKTKEPNGGISARGHAWLYVETDGYGILIDPTWGAGGVKDGAFVRFEDNMSWFHIDPQWLIFTHYPDNPEYQFLDEPLSWESFRKLPYLTPETGDFGLDVDKVFQDCLSGKTKSFPVFYSTYKDCFQFLDIPQQKTLTPGVFYTFTVRKKEAERLVLVHNKEFVYEEEWIREGDDYTLKFMPTAAGFLALSVPGEEENTFHRTVSYEVSKPTADALKAIEKHKPFWMPEMKVVKNVDIKRLQAVGITGHQVLEAVRKDRIKSLPVLFKDAESRIKISSIPLSDCLKCGKTYSFSFVSKVPGDWAVINEEDWYQEWNVDPQTGLQTIRVTPLTAGTLKISVQLDDSLTYRGVLMYKVQ